jgi:CRISPR-associated protein Csb2
MARALLLSVRFHNGRYYGAGDWPPSPARLFQALVAGAARGHSLSSEGKAALGWLETLGAPLIATPAVRTGQGLTTYVPNNDLDAVGGDPRRVSEIRAPKASRPRLFDAAKALLYAWSFEGSEAVDHHAQAVCKVAERLYQLGRGVDAAWAWAELLDESEIGSRLARHAGVQYRPAKSELGAALLCPQKGSLASLEAQFAANRKRFTIDRKRKAQLFTKPPKPRFASVAYNVPEQRRLFDLRAPTSDAAFAPWRLTRAAELTAIVRDGVTSRLRKALPADAGKIERALIGRNANEADKATRVRITPLPSIGHSQTDRAIRRLLVEVPPNCPVSPADLAWSFSGLDLGIDHETGEVLRQGMPILSPAEDRAMLDHYCIGEPAGARLWRTVTPAALPQGAARRRIEPSRLRERSEQKTGSERMQEQSRAAGAVFQALRHAGVGTTVEAIRVQREPFERKGERAETFAPGTRFAKERLWHVELAFAEPVRGPLIIGDGRYLGLGLMAPVRGAWRDVVIFTLRSEPSVSVADTESLLRAVRRALMSLSRDSEGSVPRLFSGHETEGGPASSGRHEHVFLAAADLDGDGFVERLVVAAPWICDHSARAGRGARGQFDRVVSSLKVVRAGRLGVVDVGLGVVPMAGGALIGPSCIWESLTRYLPTRHAGRGNEVGDAALRDLIVECGRRGLPKPVPELLELTTGPNGGGVSVRARLRFATAVEGPIMLGRDSHVGGGLFAAGE